MALPDLMAIMDLYMVVEVGLVDGTMPTISPTGSATSMVPFTVSSLTHPNGLHIFDIVVKSVDAAWFL